MKTLAIDFGLKKIGLAISEGQLAEPYAVIRIKNVESGIKQIKEICQKENIEGIVIGLSQGMMADQTLDFGYQLRKVTGLPIYFEDETLTSKEAKKLMVKIGKPKKKRQKQNHTIAACLILQAFLDRQN